MQDTYVNVFIFTKEESLFRRKLEDQHFVLIALEPFIIKCIFDSSVAVD